MDDDISILIPTYNRGAMLIESILSIQKQTVRPTAIVIYDDGSTDNTPSIIESMASVDRTIHYIRTTENRGVAYARSVLLAECKTAFAAWQDSDDLSHPDRVRRQWMALRDGPFHLCLCAGHRFHDHPPFMVDDILYPVHIANASAMWRTVDHPKIDLGHKIAGEDSDWLKRFGRRPLLIPETLYFIREHADRIGVWKRDHKRNPDWIARMTGKAVTP